jgi:predicted DNA-binding transcriptional regulator YafY
MVHFHHQEKVMRADRLVAELLLLQTHGKLSAARLAREMQVSIRTIYRDMTALNTAGIPIYADNGTNGGYQLVEGYRTQLTGLTSHELQALFAMHIPAILGELGMDEAAQAAIRKLRAALPETQVEDGAWMGQRFLYDPASWQPPTGQYPDAGILPLLRSAVWENHVCLISLRLHPMAEVDDLAIHPYALVLKENRWYLVYHRKQSLRVNRLEQISSVRVLDETFKRDQTFNLPDFWQDWVVESRRQQQRFPVGLHLHNSALPTFENRFHNQIQSMQPFNEQWTECRCLFDDYNHARGSLLAWGGAIRIFEPETLRLGMIDFAEQFLTTNQ